MNRVQLHPDGLVIIESDAGVYIDTPTNYEADAGEMFQGVGVYQQIYYRQGVKHYRITTIGDEPFMLPPNYAPYDALILRVPDLLAAQTARQESQQPDLPDPLSNDFARVVDGRIEEIVRNLDMTLEQYQSEHPLPPEYGVYVQVDDTAQVGYDYANGAWSPHVRTLAEAQSEGFARVRAATRFHIEADWPIWRQLNADAGIYPAEVKAQKDADIAACVTESNRVEDAIDAAIDVAGVDAAVASLNLPTLPVVI